MSRVDEIKRLLTNYHRRLQALQERKALYGLDTPIAILTEIQDIEIEVEKLRAELKEVESSTELISPTNAITTIRARHVTIGGIVKGLPLWSVISVGIFALVVAGGAIAFFVNRNEKSDIETTPAAVVTATGPTEAEVTQPAVATSTKSIIPTSSTATLSPESVEMTFELYGSGLDGADVTIQAPTGLTVMTIYIPRGTRQIITLPPGDYIYKVEAKGLGLPTPWPCWTTRGSDSGEFSVGANINTLVMIPIGQYQIPGCEPSPTSADAPTPTPLQASDSSLELTDVAVIEKEKETLLDVKVRNLADEVAFITSIDFELLESRSFQYCPNPDPVKSSEEYDANFPVELPNNPYLISKSISQEVASGETDRFQFKIASTASVEGQSYIVIYQLMITLHYNKDAKVSSDKILLMVPFTPKYDYLGPYCCDPDDSDCVEQETEDVYYMLNLPGVRSQEMKEFQQKYTQ